MSEYKIKKISQIDKSQLSDFYKKTYPQRHKSLTNNWHWWYRVGYNEFEPLILSVNDKVIGQAGLLPIDLNILEKKVPAIYFVDFSILAKYQNKGFGQILTREWMKICPNQITFCNNKSLKVFKKFGWNNNLSTKRLVRPINTLKFLPVVRRFNFNFINRTLRYFIKKKYSRNTLIKLYKINDNFKIINDSFKRKINIKNDELAEIIRDEKWLHWRLMESPYKSDIFFFEFNNNFAIVHIYKVENIRRLNILFTYSTDKPLENELFIQIINWAINNDIDVVWAVNSNIKYENTFSKIFSKAINFASWSSNKKISEILNKGLLDPQGIDSDIDSSLYIE